MKIKKNIKDITNTKTIKENQMFYKHNEYIVNTSFLYNVKETAHILRVKENTIYTWCYQKKLTPIKSGSKSLFLGAEILDFLNIDRNIVLEINTD